MRSVHSVFRVIHLGATLSREIHIYYKNKRKAFQRMPVKLKWPWIGIAIPCFLIAFIGYGSHYFILSNFASKSNQILFQCCLTMIWISYYLAIYTNPGRAPRSLYPQEFEWNNYCKKCQSLKPQRAHHCKTCKQCVLMMDHHCPWTMNCVGLENFPHFMRFLFWVIVTTMFLQFQLVPRIVFLFKHRKLPRYMFYTSELLSLTILTPLDAFVLLTIVLLSLRCISNQIFSGRSQIEVWEMERLKNLFYSRRLIPQLIRSAKQMYPQAKILEDEDEVEKLINNRRLRFEEIINFPYDIDPWTNATNLLGSPLQWLWPLGKPREVGVNFQQNEIAEYSPGSGIKDILLSLPWPPDGGRKPAGSSTSPRNIESSMESGEQLVRKRLPDIHQYISRAKWENDWGENLQDFGVDIDAESEDPIEE